LRLREVEGQPEREYEGDDREGMFHEVLLSATHTLPLSAPAMPTSKAACYSHETERDDTMYARPQSTPIRKGR
jgi:hypothetical protein